MNTPQIRVMNKADLLPETQRLSLTNAGNTVYVSAARKHGLEGLLEAIDARLEIDAPELLRVRIPQAEGRLLAQIEARARILKRDYRESDVQMEVEAPASLARILEPFVVKTRNKPRAR